MTTDRLTSADLAAYLRCGVGKARRLMGGEIPGVYEGRQWTVAKADVDAWLAAKTKVEKHRRAKGSRGRGKALGAPAKRGSAA